MTCNAYHYLPVLLSLFGMSTGLFFSITGFAQTPLKPDTTVFTIVECQPQFPGGMDSLTAFITRYLHYPSEAQKAGIKGKVFVSFIVELDGTLSAITVFIGLGYGCDEEAVRVIRAMPRWAPGSQSGRLLRVKYNLPLRFGIENPKRKGH